ncbi:MAG TPA: hypothetical protein VJ577_17100, partial [Burkholderiaceae bacterium]|nr:hypothetical protein [Burkholderiaceae bacterium]
MKFFSKSTSGFYDSEIHSNNRSANVLEITDDQHAELMATQAIGKFIQADEGGFPVAVDPNPEPVEKIRERTPVEIRAQRAPMLDTLAGIAGRVVRKDDRVTADAADNASDALLDITTLPPFLAAETYDDMKAAILARYRKIVASAPD